MRFDDRTGAHPLTSSERQRLDELEGWFQRHDASLAALLAHGPDRRSGGVLLALMAAAILGPLMLLSMVALFGIAAVAFTAVSVAATVAFWSRSRRPGHRPDPG